MEEKESFLTKIRKFFRTLSIVLFTLAVVYFVINSNEQLKKEIFSSPQLQFLEHLPKLNPARLKDLKAGWSEALMGFLKRFEKSGLPEPLANVVKKSESKEKNKSDPKTAKKTARPINPAKAITLYFKNGNAISGEFVSESASSYVIYWEGGNIAFPAGDIERVERNKILPGTVQLAAPDEKNEGSWPYQHDVVVRLTNGEVLDASIRAVTKDQITVRTPVEGGGNIEQDIPRAKIEYLKFKPIENERSKEIEANLKKQFSGMKFYEDGNFTIVTDSYSTWVREYKNILRRNYTDIYLNFFGLFKERSPNIQNFVVIFDNHRDFVEYAVADGVPGWMVLGFFQPDDEVLYLFNALGDQFSKVIEEAVVGQSGKAIDQAANQVKQEVGSRYDAFVEGQAQDIKDKFGRAHSLIRDYFRNLTASTLKHESAHEIFHNWGLQSIIVSKLEKNQAALVEKKKEFLKSDDYHAKRKLIRELMSMRHRDEISEINAANSWFVEGIAAYCETSSLGDPNEERLYTFQEMMRKNAVFPIEQLSVYKIGSFPGVYPDAMLNAYAQSWAFVTFLMHRYPEEFLNYLNRMSKETPKEHDDLAWLLQALGKDLKVLEAEFMEFMKQYLPLDDPDIKRMNLMRDVFESF